MLRGLLRDFGLPNADNNQPSPMGAGKNRPQTQKHSPQTQPSAMQPTIQVQKSTECHPYAPDYPSAGTNDRPEADWGPRGIIIKVGSSLKPRDPNTGEYPSEDTLPAAAAIDCAHGPPRAAAPPAAVTSDCADGPPDEDAAATHIPPLRFGSAIIDHHVSQDSVDFGGDDDSPSREEPSPSYDPFGSPPGYATLGAAGCVEEGEVTPSDTVPSRSVPAPAAPWRNAKEGVCRLHVEFSASRSHGNVSSPSSGSDQSRQRAMLPGRNASRESRSRSRSPPRASSEITILKDEMSKLQILATVWRKKLDVPVKMLEKMIKNEQ